MKFLTSEGVTPKNVEHGHKSGSVSGAQARWRKRDVMSNTLVLTSILAD